MAQKRASDEPEPEAKRGAPSKRILASIDAYRLVLSNAGQALAAQLLDDSKLDVADKWLQDAAPTAIGNAILTLCADYAQHKEIVCMLLAAMPAIWTIIVDGIPFVIRLYCLEAAQNGMLEPLFLSITDTAAIDCQHPDTGDTILHYAAENMHAEVVCHFLLNLRCKVINNKTGHHALFAPFVMGSVEAEPMERIIRAFHRARQHNLSLYDPNKVVGGVTILGLLEKCPYPNLLRVWMQSYACDGKVSHDRSIWSASAILAHSVLATLECFRNRSGYNVLLQCIYRKDVDGATKLLQDGLQIARCPAAGHYVPPINIACRKNFREIIPLLISYGANPSRGCVCDVFDGIVPLTIAVYGQDFETFQLLLDNGASLRSAGGLVHPVVMMIRQPSFHAKLISLLPTIDIHRQYSVYHCESKHRIRCTMLSLCVESGNVDLVTAVLQLDGRTNIDDADESLLVAIEREDCAMVNLLLRYMTPKTCECIHRAARARDPNIFTSVFSSIQSDPVVLRTVAATSNPLVSCTGCQKQTYTFDSSALVAKIIEEWSCE